MHNDPEFFWWTSDVNKAGAGRFPRAHLLSLDPRLLESAKACPVCGVETPLRYGGDITLRVEDAYGPAREWPDCLDAMPFPPASLIISERIVRDLRRAGIESFIEDSATVEHNECALLRYPPPQYFYMHVSGRIDVQIRTGAADEGTGVCPNCFARHRYVEVEQYLPIRESWDRSAIFQLRNFPNYQVFCTRQVVELARRERWSGCSFHPMDILHRRFYGSPGVDYLGEEWPPRSWYPDPPQAEKSLEEWIEELRSADRERGYRATLALLEIGESAVLGLSTLLTTGTSLERYRAANVLRGLSQRGTTVPPALKEQIAKELVHG